MLNITLTESKQFRYDSNRNKKVVIFNDDIISTNFQDFYNLLLKFSTKTVLRKELQPLIYQQNRRQSEQYNMFYQDDSKYKDLFVTLITLDFDDGLKTREDVESLLKQFNYISYNSWSNGLKPNRFRILLPINPEIFVKWSDYTDCKKELSEYFWCAKESFSSGIMYLPCFYEGLRSPDLKINFGEDFDLNYLVEKFLYEASIRQKTRTKINYNDIKLI